MKVEPNHLYHIYNQGNKQEVIFRERADYLHFLHRFRERVLPHCHGLAYCLMPNHFHFLVDSTPASAQTLPLGK